jgi:hypothetical protein
VRKVASQGADGEDAGQTHQEAHESAAWAGEAGSCKGNVFLGWGPAGDGWELKDIPHPHESCDVTQWYGSTDLDKFCDYYYCFVCNQPAKDCPEWG